jgi:hypothetical protein
MAILSAFLIVSELVDYGAFGQQRPAFQIVTGKYAIAQNNHSNPVRVVIY